MTITENSMTTLTERERQIAGLVSEGLSNKGIGRVLNITDGTIKVHLHSIFRKLEISNRTCSRFSYYDRSDPLGTSRRCSSVWIEDSNADVHTLGKNCTNCPLYMFSLLAISSQPISSLPALMARVGRG